MKTRYLKSSFMLLSLMTFIGCGDIDSTTPKDNNQNRLSYTEGVERENLHITQAEELYPVSSIENESPKEREDDNITINRDEQTKGAELFKKCAGCHGIQGEKKALGKSSPIGGEPLASLIYQLREYRAGRLSQYGMGGVMKGQVVRYSDKDIKRIALYIHNLSQD